MERQRPLDWLTARRASAVALLAAVALMGARAADMFGQSGESTSYGPLVEHTDTFDSDLGVLNWNMHDETMDKVDDIKEIVQENSVDIVLLQEVNADDAAELQNHFIDWHINFVIGERLLQQPDDGGYGNVIMTKGKHANQESKSMDGESVGTKVLNTVEGIGVDVARADTGIRRTKAGMQERRAISSVDFNVGPLRQEMWLKIINTHISSNSRVHQEQLSKVLEYVKDRSKEDKPVIFCADLNDDQEDVITLFTEEAGMIVSQTTEPTIVGKDVTTDYCMYRSEGVLGLGSFVVLSQYKTDHHPVLGRFTIDPPTYYLESGNPDRTKTTD